MEVTIEDKVVNIDGFGAVCFASRIVHLAEGEGD